MKLLKIALAAATLILATAWAAKADGIDPVLKMGGGGGSPGCVQNGVSFQGTTDQFGNLSGTCENNTGSVITSFSSEILLSNTGPITPELDCLLAPFQAGCPNANPEETSLDWTVSCAPIGSIERCTASKPDTSGPPSEGGCSDFSSYINFGVLPGCDLSVSTVPGGGTFAPDAAFDIVPDGVTPAGLVPEPASLSMLLFGLGGLPFLRRRFAR